MSQKSGQKSRMLFDTPQHHLSALNDSEKIDWLRLIRTENVGPVTFYRLLERFGTAGKALDALPHLAKKGGRLKPQTPPPISQIEAEWNALEKFGGEFVFAADEDYPLSLSAVEDAPPVVAVKGNRKLLSRAGIGMVGARNASLNGKKFAEKLARELGEAGQVIVSGLARGIDTSAHQGSLETGTIAVVAGGVNILYPPENRNLYDQIADYGLVVAESPFGVEPIAQHFPKRNRIISGLSAGVVVVEATLKSGSLITARMAGEQGRDVFAVPGHPLDPRAAGPNKLLKEGACLIENAQDVLQALSDFSGNMRGLHDLPAPDFSCERGGFDENEVESGRDLIMGCLSTTPVTVDEIIQTCHMKVGAVAAVLLELELAGRIQRLPGNRVILLI